MRVSVVIPVKDDPRVVACVASVCALAGEAGALDIIVVDNGSAAGFEDVLESLPATVLDAPGVTVYAARNRGADAAAGEVVFFTDADCMVEPGWLGAGIEAIMGGADVVQGRSGSLGGSAADRLIQRRYAAHLRGLRPGAATECDTRNLAVRRSVFGAVRFDEAFRRVGDTAFGLEAELAGFRVAYAPAMRLRHAHETSMALFLAKQACHGWGAQRLVESGRCYRWHSGHLRLVARCRPALARLPGRHLLGAALTATALAGGRALDGAIERAASLPGGSLAFWLLEKLALAGGHLSYRRGEPEPSPSGLLGRRVLRD